MWDKPSVQTYCESPTAAIRYKVTSPPLSPKRMIYFLSGRVERQGQECCTRRSRNERQNA